MTKSSDRGWRLGSFRLLGLGLAILLVATATGFGWWVTHPYWKFPVEEIVMVDGSPVISPGDAIQEERWSVAICVRGRTWLPVSRMILDNRFEQFGPAYAFTGREHGRVFTLGSGGIDSYVINAEGDWAGDPRAFVLKRTKAPEPSLP